MSAKTKITPEAARRIQSHADRTGTNQELKRRAMRAAARNEALEQEPMSEGSPCDQPPTKQSRH